MWQMSMLCEVEVDNIRAVDLRRAVEPDSESVRPSSPLTARSERRMSSGSRRTHDERRRSLRRALTAGDTSPAPSIQPPLMYYSHGLPYTCKPHLYYIVAIDYTC